jgi:3-hydroxybutyrate dehydrogenase
MAAVKPVSGESRAMRSGHGCGHTLLVDGQIDAKAKAKGLLWERVIKEGILASQPNRRFVEIAELAAVVVYLCADADRSITGAMLLVDGGWTAR